MMNGGQNIIIEELNQRGTIYQYSTKKISDIQFDLNVHLLDKNYFWGRQLRKY